MFLPLNHILISFFGLALTVSTAPLNGRANVSRGIVGWLCHYDGPSSSIVDASLDLPALLGALCAKVNYDFPGCESFDPNPTDLIPGPPPLDDGTAIQSASVDQDEDSDDDQDSNDDQDSDDDDDSDHDDDSADHDENHDDSDHEPPNYSPDGNNSDSPASSAPAAENDHDSNPPTDSSEEDDNSADGHSFNNANDEEPHSSHHSHEPEPSNSSPEQDPNSHIGSLSNGESDDDAADGCQPNELYSSELGRCVDQSFFFQPQDGGTCQKGIFDAVIELCLDVSTLGLTDPIHVDAAALSSPSAAALNSKCPLGQQYSSLLSVCVDNAFFADPLSDHQCQGGWKLDLVLGICLDLAGCQNSSHDS